jgi:predicted GH43/DUF377 family glycosyl hydrolase
MLKAKRTGVVLRPDFTRVVFRPFLPGDPHRTTRILGRILALPEETVEQQLGEVMKEFGDRHQKLHDFFMDHFQRVEPFLFTDAPVSRARQQLIGAYFTQEYSLESAALFNPSMVWHPDQSGLERGEKRFILSLRAVGEGHISSITFRSGIVDSQNQIRMNPTSRFVTTPEIHPNAEYEKQLFAKKLGELDLACDFTNQVLGCLCDSFDFESLQNSVQSILREAGPHRSEDVRTASGIMSLAQSNYELGYPPEQDLSERIIFPSTPAEINGIEDARFVEFRDEKGVTTYYATYTAYDGKVILPQILETRDFLRFKISTLNGPAVQNKGMALFPRKVNGRYAVLSRQDGENIYLMYSDDIHFWHTKKIVVRPTYQWEFIQLGNCGSPIETEDGWLVLSHGVGHVRKYAIGAFLLDRDDPSKVIGRLKHPLLSPDENEREGYVPNVVYSCGGAIKDGDLIIPYAMADYASTFATVRVSELLAELKNGG